MYFPTTSNSKFTIVPTLIFLKFVCSNVYGIIATLNSFSFEFTTVKLTPFTVIEPFSIVILFKELLISVGQTDEGCLLISVNR